MGPEITGSISAFYQQSELLTLAGPVLVMRLVFFTVCCSPGLLLLFAVVLIALLHCAWTPFDKGNGHAPGLAYGPGIDALLALCELPCRKH